TAESVEENDEEDSGLGPTTLTAHQRSRVRSFVRDIVERAPDWPPWERIAAVKLAIISTATQVWEAEGPHSWPTTVSAALMSLDEATWPGTSGDQAAAVAAVGLYRLRMALPPDE